MILLGVTGVWGVHPRAWLKSRWWLLGAAWILLLALSWFWSEDKAMWGQRLEVKLPVLLLPLAFSLLPGFSIRQLRFFTIFLVVLLLVSGLYGVYFLMGNMDHYLLEYNRARVLPTPAKGDHIRFSMVVALTIVWCGYMWPRLGGKVLKWFIGISVLLLATYLHLLAARSGLVIFYVFVLAWAFYVAVRKNVWIGAGILIALALAIFLALENFPTFRMRVGYYQYMMILVERGEISTLYSDMNRFISYNIAAELIGQNPLTGVGAGDAAEAMKYGYDTKYPGTDEHLKILPHNQFLMIALSAGIPAMLLFTWWVLAPLRLVKRSRNGFFFLLVWLVLLLPMLIEPMLEIQFGVFVYLFFLLWQRHALLHEEAAIVHEE
jgi:O-antigen ligase